MTHPTDSSWDGPSAPEGGAADDADAVESIEMYEDDGRVVLFDGENPLAWLEASRTVTLSDLA